jgi:hypothetical protein
MDEPVYNSVLLAVDLETLDYVNVWMRDDFNEQPKGSDRRWYCTGDEAAYTWPEVVQWAEDANCSLYRMVQAADEQAVAP